MSDHALVLIWTVSLSVTTGLGFLAGMTAGMAVADWLAKKE